VVITQTRFKPDSLDRGAVNVVVFGAAARETVADGFGTRAELVDHLLLHQVEAHGDDGHAQHQVHGAENETHVQPLGRVDLIAGDNVSEANGAQRDEAEVGAVQKVPVFPLGEKKGAATNVAHHDCKAQSYRNSDLKISFFINYFFLFYSIKIQDR